MAGRYDIALKRPVPVVSKPKKRKRALTRGRLNMGKISAFVQKFRPKKSDLFFVRLEGATERDVNMFMEGLREEAKEEDFSFVVHNYPIAVKRVNVHNVVALRVNVRMNGSFSEFQTIEELKKVIAKEISTAQGDAIIKNTMDLLEVEENKEKK